MEQKVITPPASDTTVTFMTEAIQKRLDETVKPLEEKLAASNQRIVELDQETKTLKTQIKEGEDWRVKYDELVGKVGNIPEAEEGKKRLDAARNKVIPELISENERLRGELIAATELANAHSKKADNNRIAAYIESALARYPEEIKPQVRTALEGAHDIVGVDRILTSLETLGLVRESFPPPAKATGGAPAEAGAGGHTGGGQLPAADAGTGTPAEAGSLPPSKDWMSGATGGAQKESKRNLRGRTLAEIKEARERHNKSKQPMTVMETMDRQQLPKPKSLKDPDEVITERGAPQGREDGSSAVVQSLVESLGH